MSLDVDDSSVIVWSQFEQPIRTVLRVWWSTWHSEFAPQAHFSLLGESLPASLEIAEVAHTTAGRPLSSAPLESTWSLAVKRQGVQGVGGVLCNHGQMGHQAIMYELCLLAERGRHMEIFAATGTNAPPSAKHDRNPLLPIVTVLLPVATLPRTYCAKNKRDIPGAGSIHRPLRL